MNARGRYYAAHAPSAHTPAHHSREVFSPVLELHVLELQNLGLATAERQAKFERWARFLRARTAEELETLAQEDAAMSTARNKPFTRCASCWASRLDRLHSLVERLKAERKWPDMP